MSLKQLGNGRRLTVQLVDAPPISDNVTTPPVFKSETEGLHHLHMELQLLKDQVQDEARVCNAVARGDFSQKIAGRRHGATQRQSQHDGR